MLTAVYWAIRDFLWNRYWAAPFGSTREAFWRSLAQRW
jgi:hypothetical protein